MGERGAGSEGSQPAFDAPSPPKHPSIFEPGTLFLGLAMAVLGAVIGIQLLTRVGITPNSSVIAAILAIALARIPLAVCRPFTSLARQNLMQTVISGATFGGATSVTGRCASERALAWKSLPTGDGASATG